MDKETYSISKIKNGILRTVLVRGVMKNKVGELENISSSLPGSILLFPLPLSIIIILSYLDREISNREKR